MLSGARTAAAAADQAHRCLACLWPVGWNTSQPASQPPASQWNCYGHLRPMYKRLLGAEHTGPSGPDTTWGPRHDDTVHWKFHGMNPIWNESVMEWIRYGFQDTKLPGVCLSGLAKMDARVGWPNRPGVCQAKLTAGGVGEFQGCRVRDVVSGPGVS